jgi:16S rRNA (guanine(966)-N(2))-methyltransferase RsmD
MACEALQRGAREVVAVDHHRRIAAIARANLEAVAASLSADVTVHCVDVVRWLGKGTAGPFDLIYVDPPYASGLYAPIGAAVAAGPWLRPGGTMVWECASDRIPDLPTGWQLRDRRRYGGSTLLMLEKNISPEASREPDLSLPRPSRGGTDSRPPRTDPPG